MWRTVHRTRGASAIGASRPGGSGPFGRRPDDGQDDEQDGGGAAQDPTTDFRPSPGGRDNPKENRDHHAAHHPRRS